MAYTTPTNTTITYAELVSNTDIQQWVDDLIWVGSLLRNGVAISGLANGSEILPTWGALAYNNANITHNSTGNWVSLTFNSEFWDTDGMHSTSVNTGRLTFQRAGMYSLSGSIWWTGNATGSRGVGFIKNATPIWQVMAPATAGWHYQTIHTDYHFAVNDYVELRAFQDSGGNLNMLTESVYGVALKAQYIGKAP